MRRPRHHQMIEPPGVVRISCAPGSAHALQEHADAAWPCYVAELRFCGVYLPAPLIKRDYIRQGWLVTLIIEHTAPKLYRCDLHAGREADAKRLGHTLFTRDVKLQGQVYLLRGESADPGYLRSDWPQDWLCGPDFVSIESALDKLAPWLTSRYTGTWR